MTPAAAALAAVLALGAPPPPAGAAAAGRAGPERVCRIGDARLSELSGLVATRTGYVVVNDGADDPAGRRVFFLDRRCKVVRAVAYPSRPRDTEDLAAAADGTLWVADIGDNNLTRSTIALWRLDPGARSPRLHRLAYPDGRHDAEALVLTASGTPVVVTKAIGSASLYVPTGPLRAGRTTPLRLAGSVRLPATTTSNPFSLPGRLLITGGAASPDGRRVTLRTYADAFEFDAPDGDLVRALTTGTPRQIALPDEPQGESVAYTADGGALLTVSEDPDGPGGARPELLRYPLSDRPAPPAPAATPSTAAPSTAAPSTAARSAAAPTASSDPAPLGIVLIGAALAGAAGLLLLLRRRHRRTS